MSEYSPKRRTALVLAGSGTSGAYHAGVLRALEESGVKIDLVVGSGVGTVGAAYAAVAGSGKLLGKAGFWAGARWAAWYRLRPVVAASLGLAATSLLVFMVPFAVAALLGLALPVALAAEGLFGLDPGAWLDGVAAAPRLYREPYLALFSAPIFALCVLLLGTAARFLLSDRRQLAESFEAAYDARRALERLRRGLWEIARGAALKQQMPSEAELGKRYVGLAEENFGEPGFRELILRTADLDTGEALCFTLLSDEARASYARARTRGRVEPGEDRGTVDLRAAGHAPLFFHGVATGVLPPLLAKPRRVTFPRRSALAGETHRLVDASLVGGCGIAEAVAAGAEQVIVACPVPERASPPTRRRGPGALLGGTLQTLERQGFVREIEVAERLNRVVATLGHRGGDGRQAWQDPATGQEHSAYALYVVRPEKRLLGPLELDGAHDPTTEVEQTIDDLAELGYRDTLRQFVGPVVGASPVPSAERPQLEEPQPIEL